jgi:YebC/PmpR family DNA-binding regulatory protein
MAGHNKWSKVKHIKAKVDAVKGRIFSKCAHEIALAARAGGGDPAANARLRTSIDNAKAVSMPRENIERAIKKGTGELGGAAIQEVTYEGYGPSGTAFLIEIATDNLNRSAQDIRTIFSKNQGAAATPGSVAYQFERKGEIILPAEVADNERILEVAVMAGADDVISDETEHVIHTPPNGLATVAQELRSQGLPIQSEKFTSIPQTPVLIDDLTIARQALKLFDLLDSYDDTRNVFTNFELSDSILAQLDT